MGWVKRVKGLGKKNPKKPHIPRRQLYGPYQRGIGV